MLSVCGGAKKRCVSWESHKEAGGQPSSKLKCLVQQDELLFACLFDPEVTPEQLRQVYGYHAKALYGVWTTDTLIHHIRRDVWVLFSKIAIALDGELARIEGESVPEVVEIALAPDDAPLWTCICEQQWRSQSDLS